MLTINDLSMNEELDRAAMRSVLGGMSLQGLSTSALSVLRTLPNETGSPFLSDSPLWGAMGQSTSEVDPLA